MIKLVFFVPICVIITLVYAATKRERARDVVLEALKFTGILILAAVAGSVLFAYLSAG